MTGDLHPVFSRPTLHAFDLVAPRDELGIRSALCGAQWSYASDPASFERRVGYEHCPDCRKKIERRIRRAAEYRSR